MLTLAYFGIESSGLSLVVDLLILFVVVLYLSLIYWTYADARRRIVDPMLVGCATVASLFPFVGTIVYMILRPPEYLEDVRERELEMQAAEARLHEFDHSLCPHCDYRVERDFVRCPSCLRKLKDRCVNCSRPLDQAWTICPYCETEVPPAERPARTRRRRTQASIDAEQAELAGEKTARPETDRQDRQETARAKAARERKERAAEREAAASAETGAIESVDAEQEAAASTVAASEPAPRARSGRSTSGSSRRARPST
ncbi:MAG TPA: zinc ribbon domain-containing protein [Solirubrobacteraceae bacterium]|nr:zinc ribbon domain-containing protein [Solirubrobacteraceae bacterium]